MKKLFMMAVMAAVATTSYAQDDLVKQAEKLSAKGQHAEAIKMITPALTSDQTTDKAKAWNAVSKMNYAIYMENQQIMTENQLKKQNNPYDTVGMNRALVASFEAAIKCDEYDQQPNEKGKVKIRYRSENQKTWQMMRPHIINIGLAEYNKKNLAEAVKDWRLYIDGAESTLFTGVDLGPDQYRSEVCYFIGLASYQNKDYKTATKYALMAAEDSAKAKEASEIVIFAAKDGATTKEDSVAYLNILKKFHAEDPQEQRYFNLLMEYYSKAGDQDAMMAWVEDEIKIAPQNKMPWALKGEALMNARKWDEAVVAYQKAAELDPNFVQVIFNAGVCLNSKAIELKDQLADKNTGGLTKANADKVKAVLSEAKVYLEKSKELDPTRSSVNWAYPLYQIYYALGDAAKSSEMEKLLNK